MTTKSIFETIAPGMWVRLDTRYRLNDSHSFDNLDAVMSRKHNISHTVDSAYLTARKALSIIPKGCVL